MSDSYKYKPRHGFDIRAGGSKRKAKPKFEAAGRKCEHPGCENKAQARVAKSPQEPNSYIWLCAEHAREHNKNWNFFEGMSVDEAKEFRESAAYGHRPTWKMGANRGAAAAAAGGAASTNSFSDPLSAMAAGGIETTAQKKPGGAYRDGRKLTKLQASAFKTLDLKYDTPRGEIRTQYTALLKRYHPDANGGERGAEERLQEVIKAHKILKKAGFCE